MSPATLEAIKAVPKADLHMHLDGSVSKGVLEKVAGEHDVPLDQAILDNYPNAGPYDADADPEEFKRFLDAFSLPLSIMKTPELIHATTLEVLRDLASQNVIYAEMRLAPSYVASAEHSMEQMIASTLNAMSAGYEETGVLTKLIIAIPREIDPQYVGDVSGNGLTAQDIVDAAMAFEGQGVVGIDLACAEHFGPEPYIDLFRATIGSQLRRTIHAGEAGPQQLRNIEIAVREMGADGIGHGLSLGGRGAEALLDEIKAKGIRIERCPASNIAMNTTDGQLDHLGDLMKQELLVSIGSDDYGIFGEQSRVAENLFLVSQVLGLGTQGIRQLTKNALLSSFASEDEKRALLRRF